MKIRATKADKETMARNILRNFGFTELAEMTPEWPVAVKGLAKLSERELTALLTVGNIVRRI